MHIKGTTAGPTTIVLAVLSSMGGFLFGYDTGQIAGEYPTFSPTRGSRGCGNPDPAFLQIYC